MELSFVVLDVLAFEFRARNDDFGKGRTDNFVWYNSVCETYRRLTVHHLRRLTYRSQTFD
jgi:hypothetical protein